MTTATALTNAPVRHARGARFQHGGSAVQMSPDLALKDDSIAHEGAGMLNPSERVHSDAVNRASGNKLRLRLTRRGRLVFFGAPSALIITGLLSLGLGGFFTPVNATDSSAPAGSTSSVTVQLGDTLWAIAERSGLKGDIRDVVGRIAQLNGIKAGQIEAGQELYLPNH